MTKREEMDSPEIVFGLAAGVGTPLAWVQAALESEMRRLGYRSEVIHLSKLTRHFRLSTPMPSASSNEDRRIDAMMNRGNEVRIVTGRNDILALMAIGEVRVRRPSRRAPLYKHAFILRQLKKPEEVYRLRDTYGDGFHLIGAYCPRVVREHHLRDRGIAPRDVRRLIDRDEHEASDPGQDLRETFHLSDVFIQVGSSPRGLRAQIHRLLDLLFGVEIIGPLLEEFGMFYAHASALRSTQLGRQVGAAILGPRGDVLSVGTNEVPRFGGGVYLEGDLDDLRDHVRGRDSSDELREEIVAEISARLVEDWGSLDDSEKQRIMSKNRLRLRRTTVSALTEFGRAVHAEAEAILSASRMKTSVQGGKLFCTTFPCHVCAKHIVAAGIDEVTFIEPYPKSRAVSLYPDSISLENRRPKRVTFRPFVGVAPRRYPALFSMRSEEGREVRRKDDVGRPIVGRPNLRLRMPYFSALDREEVVAKELRAHSQVGVSK